MPPVLPLAVVLVCAAAASAAAQGLPHTPVTLLDGRVELSGSASAAVASGGTDTAFNAGDYDQDTMRLAEFALGATFTLHPSAIVTADVRAAGGAGTSWYVRPSTLLLGLRPLAGLPVTLSAGVMQSPFAHTGRQGYGRDNLLIGLPLVYQYPSSLRVPAGDGGGGAYGGYGVASDHGAATSGGDGSYGYGARGLPVIDPRGWNAGVRLDAGGERAGAAVALTRGTLSNPFSRGESAGWEVSGRATAQPVAGLVLGASLARGQYVTASEGREALRETAIGADGEYSRGYWLVRAEVVHSRREAPPDADAVPGIGEPLNVTGLDVEGRYRLLPGVYLAARVGHLWFAPVPSSGGSAGWDDNVGRFEGGLGWSLSRPILVKLSYQYNRRDGRAAPSELQRAAAQVLVWF